MNSPRLSEWLKKQKDNKEKANLIETALLTGRMWTYYVFRFKYFAIKSILTVGIIAIQIKILIDGFGDAGFLKQALGAGAVATLLSSFWWAGLETMRAEIRKQKRSENGGVLIPQILLTWQKITTNTMLWGIFLGLLALTLWLLTKQKIDPFDLYLFALVLKVSLEIPLRAFHSSVYATRRIYKPLGWVLGVEIAGFLLFLILQKNFGAWSVGISTMAISTLNFLVSWKYISKVFHHIGYERALKILEKKPKRPYPAPTPIAFLQEALPLTLFRLDGILLIALAFSRGPTDTLLLTQFITLVIAIPLLHTSQEWAQLLYFDFKKLELNLFQLLQKRFEAASLYIPIFLSTCLWLLLIPSLWILSGSLSLPPWQIFALLLGSSYLSQVTIKYYSLGERNALTLWGISLLLCFAALHFGIPKLPLPTLSLSLGGILGLHAFLMVHTFKKRHIEHIPTNLMPIGQWIKELSSTDKDIQVSWIKIDPQEISPYHVKLSLVKGLKKLLREEGHPNPKVLATTLREDEIFIFSPNNHTDISHLIKTSAGSHLLEFLSQRGTATEVLKTFSEKEPLLQSAFQPPNEWQHQPPLTFDLAQKKDSNIMLTPRDAQEILHNGLQFLLKGKGPEKDDLWEATAEESNGILTKIHAYPKSVPWKTRFAWRSHILSVSIYNNYTQTNKITDQKEKQKEKQST